LIVTYIGILIWIIFPVEFVLLRLQLIIVFIIESFANSEILLKIRLLSDTRYNLKLQAFRRKAERFFYDRKLAGL